MRYHDSVTALTAFVIAHIALGGQEMSLASSHSLWIDPPSAGKPIDWANSRVVLVKLSSESPTMEADKMTNGRLCLTCDVVSASSGPEIRQINICLGVNGPPGNANYVWGPKRHLAQNDPLIPRGNAFLAVISKPKSASWVSAGYVVPRLFVPVDPSISVRKVSAKDAAFTAILQSLRIADANRSKFWMRWLCDEWHGENSQYLKSPEDLRRKVFTPRTYEASDIAIASAALRLAEKSPARARTYLTLLSGVWGSDQGFEPFFKSCEDARSDAEASSLGDFLVEPPFPILTVERGLEIARRVRRRYVGVVLRLVYISESAMDNAKRKSLYELTVGLGSEDRSKIYNMMGSGLPLELVDMYPEGLLPPYKSDGSIPGEDGYRRKWEEYLGIKQHIGP